MVQIKLRYKIGKQIKQCRQDKSMTQKELSIISGIAESTIARIEHGKFSFSIDIIERLCEALHLDLNLIKL